MPAEAEDDADDAVCCRAGEIPPPPPAAVLADAAAGVEGVAVVEVLKDLAPSAGGDKSC